MSMLFRPRGLTSNDPKSAGNSSVNKIQSVLVYRDTWKERISADFSLGRILLRARAEKNKQVVPKKLVMTSNGFKVKDRGAIDKSEQGVRMVQSTLNKLTESNFDVVVNSILTPDIIISANVVADVVRLIYDKALDEPVFAGLYARLCYMIVRFEYDYRAAERVEVDAQKSEVRVAIVEKCQQMFDRASKAARDTSSEEEAEKLRKQNVNNIKFAGELFLKSLITQKIIGRILDEKLEGTANDMDLEVVINLLEVVGKAYEEKNPEGQPALWEKLGELHGDKRFSNRIRFLLQNLIERRNGGWKPRESEQVIVKVQQQQAQQQQQEQRYHSHNNNNNNNNNNNSNNSNSANHPHQQYHNNNNNNNYNYPHPHHRMSDPFPPPPMGKRAVSYQDISNQYGGAARRATSYSDLTGYGGYPMPPPPPPPFSSIEDEMPAEVRKQIGLARPPETLTERVSFEILRATRDAVEENLLDTDWIKNDLSRVLGPKDNERHNWMTSVYVILLRALMDTRESERALFYAALEKSTWEKSVLCRGFAWCLTKIIAERDVVDCPIIYKRFVDAVVRIPGLDFLTVTKDIIARTAKYLDALQLVSEDTEEWDEDFIGVWDKLLLAQEEKGRVVNVAEILESLSSSRLGAFMHGILPDFLGSMVQAGLFTEDELRKWRLENDSVPKFRAITEELGNLYP